MAKASNDYTKMMKDMMGAFPVDMTAMQDTFKNQAALADKMSKVVLEAAEKSTVISAGWATTTIGKIGSVTTAKEDPADYTKAITDFASAQAETSAESMAAFAEVAKKVQMETVELMMAAGKDISDDTSAAVKKATNDLTAAAKKAAAAK
ncbi:MAG: phasin, PhaP [Boseongicola sp.]|nr:MAG: phasin, PhaP [Boseongicola sp.]